MTHEIKESKMIRTLSRVNVNASSPYGSPSTGGAPFRAGREDRGHEIPASRNVTRQLSFGMYKRNLDPLATNSTMPSVRKARCHDGKY